MSETHDTSEMERPLTPGQEAFRERSTELVVTKAGAMPLNFAQMVDYAKAMSTAKGAVGAHLMGNVGACLAVMEIGSQLGMPFYAVARQSYLVNGRVAFMGQFFHSVIELHAPLKKGKNGRKLQFRYEGEIGDATLKIFVEGTFEGASEPVTYESPMIKDIAVKNSPLWKTEPKRQLIYFGVRGWQTINWPEGMLQAMTDDEAAALPPSERAIDVTPVSQDLRERLAAAHGGTAPAEREGFREGFTEATFTEVSGDQQDPAKVADAIDETIAAASGAAPPAAAEPAKTEDKPANEAKPDKAAKPAKAKKKADEPKAAAAPAALPKNAEEWAPWARAWLEAEQDPGKARTRWQAEMGLRNDLGVTSEQRDPVFEYYQERLTVLEGRS